jgi:GNAT superfamily N-acetyltransferase
MPAMDLTIRSAQDHETRVCRFLLRQTVDLDRPSDLMVASLPAAIGSAPARIVGAIALIKENKGSEAPVSLLVHVSSPFRRQAIGRALVATAVTRCRGRAPMLRVLHPVPADSEASHFLSATGFDHYEEVVYYEMDLERFHAYLQPLRDRLQRRGLVPKEARILPLRDAPRQAVLAMVARHLPTMEREAIARLQPGRADSYDLDHSVVLMIGDGPAGVVIGDMHTKIPVVHIRVVEAEYRHGWASVFVLEELARRVRQTGATRFQFFADTKVRDTARLAERAGAREIRRERWFWRPLPPSGAVAG